MKDGRHEPPPPDASMWQKWHREGLDEGISIDSKKLGRLKADAISSSENAHFHPLTPVRNAIEWIRRMAIG